MISVICECARCFSCKGFECPLVLCVFPLVLCAMVFLRLLSLVWAALGPVGPMMDQATHQPPLISNTALISEREKTKTFKLFKTGFWYIGKSTLSPSISNTLKPIQRIWRLQSWSLICPSVGGYLKTEQIACARVFQSDQLSLRLVDYKWWRLINFMSDPQRVPLFGGILPMAVTDVRNKIQT